MSNPKHPSEPEWPEADFIIGNPPFLGGRLLRRNLGDDYVGSLFRIYSKWDEWIIDFGCAMTETQASQYEKPFEYVRKHVQAARQEGETTEAVATFWRHWRPRPEMRAALQRLTNNRFAVTPRFGKHRVFLWVNSDWLPSDATIAFAFDDDYRFGLLHSCVHETWVRAPGNGTKLRERESGFRYTPTTCIETFPFPEPKAAQREAIATAAHELDELRNLRLNPPEWAREEFLEFPGSADGPWQRYVTNPDARGIGSVRYRRMVAKDLDSAKLLAKRTLTNLCNERPTWLDLAHRKLDEAVFAAYGWPPDLTDHQILERLLALNLERATAEAT